MYIGVGSISNVLDWFLESDSSGRLLCLFVAGDLSDPHFFRDLIDNKETLDVISGHEIELFLFTRDDAEPLEFLSSGGRSYICGKCVSDRAFSSDRYWKDEGTLLIRHKHISQVNVSDSVRDEIVRTSQTIAADISSTFNLSIDDMPSVILVEKVTPLRFHVIRTRGAADVRLVVDLLRRLRQLSLKGYSSLKGESRRLYHRDVFELKDSVDQALKHLLDSRRAFERRLLALGAQSEDVMRLRTQWEDPRIRAHDQHFEKWLQSIGEQSRRLVLEARNHGPLRGQVRGLNSCARKFRELSEKLSQETERIHEYEPECGAYIGLRDEISALCSKIEKDLAAKAKGESLGEFVGRAFDVDAKAEAAKSFLSRFNTLRGQSDTATGEKEDKRWDVFLSHASEDKELVVRQLAHELSQRGLAVWFDEHTLTLGDSLRQKIDEGLALSRYGVVVLSPLFFSKRWPQSELDGLVARETAGRKVILPVWHGLDETDVALYSPLLAGKMAVSTRAGIEKVADAIAKVVRDAK
jgi:hypothetical protein